MPRVSPNQKGVAFSAKVPPELYREFTKLFPIYGATTWFINESLKAFLAQIREDGTLQQDVINSIDRMVTERRELDEVTHD